MIQKITKLLMNLGIRPSYKGYPYLVHVIMLAAKAPVPATLTDLYSQTAAAFNVSPSIVQHDIRTVLRAYWDLGHTEKLSELTGYPIYERLPVKEFIYIIAEYLIRRQ